MKLASSFTVAFVTCSVGLISAITACSSSDDSNNTSSSSSSSSSSTSSSGGSVLNLNVTNYVTALCHQTNLCFPGVISAIYGDEATCVSTVTAARQTVPNGETITQAQIDACAAKVASVTDCNQQQVFTECEFAGTLADGTACSDDEQCSGRSCGKTGSGVCGTCQKLGAEGDDCTGTKPCDDALDLECSNDKCVKAIAADQPCKFADIGCVPGYKCSASENGTCKPVLKLGDTCEALSDACGAGLACDGTTTKCIAQPGFTYADLGAACGQTDPNNHNPVQCKASTCDKGTSKCVPFGKVGDACTTDTLSCGPNLDCDTTTLKCVDTIAPTCN